LGKKQGAPLFAQGWATVRVTFGGNERGTKIEKKCDRKLGDTPLGQQQKVPKRVIPPAMGVTNNPEKTPRKDQGQRKKSQRDESR